MREFRVRLKVRNVDGSSVEDLFEQAEMVAEELGALAGVIDPFVGADRSTNQVTIGLTVDVEDDLEAVQLAAGLIRTAIHAVGGATPGWEFQAVEAGEELLGA